MGGERYLGHVVEGLPLKSLYQSKLRAWRLSKEQAEVLQAKHEDAERERIVCSFLVLVRSLKDFMILAHST
jgi:hypothetical protein